MNDLLEKLEQIYQRWLQIGEEITQPDAMSDMKKFIKMSKDYKDLQAVVEAYKRYKDVIGNIANAKDIIANEKDEEFREMAKMELDGFVEEKDKCEELLKKYKEKKLELINHRKTSKKIVASQLSDTEVNSYEDFLRKLCRNRKKNSQTKSKSRIYARNICQ